MKFHRDPIRRQFLVLKKPPEYEAVKPYEMEEGYFFQHPKRDLKLRRQGEDYFLILQEKKEDSKPHEVTLTKAQFEVLWPFTEGQRILLRRSIFSIKRLKVIMDAFLGEHAPLVLAEVIFPTAAASENFKHPDFLGEEVTRREEYKAVSMARYGLPEPKGISQIGVLPYIFKDGKLQVLIITSSSGNRWIVPKGRQEPEMTPHEVALMEAVEEGGVLGTIRHDIRMRCQTSDGRSLQLYAMSISKLLGTWPEEHFRLRRLLPLSDALRFIEDPKIARAIKRLAVLIKK
jgi:CYTH domain-containing protein/8-oxo-dGTP pyrophosphatase MutT (NUDIX family)